MLGVVLGVAMSAAAVSTSVGQTADAKDSKAMTSAPAATTPPPPSAITGDFGVTVTNLYDSRGYALVTRGAMVQPYLDIYFQAYSGDGFINSIVPTLSFWSDVNSDTNFASVPGNTVPAWYEFDWLPGITINFAKHFALTVSYYEFDSPSGGFNTARSINSTLAYDDTGLLDPSKNFSLQPHITVLDELPGPGSAGGFRNGTYAEFGLTPTYTVFGKSEYPLTLTVPLTYDAGDHFYKEGISFGYVSVGVGASVPIAFIPSQFGAWTGSVGWKYFHTGDSVNIPEFRDQQTFTVSIGCKF